MPRSSVSNMADSPPSLLSFLQASHSTTIPSSTTESDIPTLSPALYSQTTYTHPEKIEISQWLTTSARFAISAEDEAKHAERLDSLNTHLSTRTTLLGSKPSIADLGMYHRLAPTVTAWTPEERTGEKGYHHIVRFIDFVQNAPVFGLRIPEGEKVETDIDNVLFVKKPVDAKEEKERKKKEKAAASTNGDQQPLVLGRGKDRSSTPPSTDTPPPPPKKAPKEKPPKAPKPSKQPAPSAPLSPALIDLRVGHILHCTPHPNADSLFVSTIAVGDAPSTPDTSLHEPSGQTVRTVCSGLNGLIPLSEMQDRMVVAVCNLKPVTMRGVKSAAMVLAASPRVKEGEEGDGHKGPVELVSPPEGAQAGERCWFEGWEGAPEGVLNPKKKVWESCQVGFTTGEGLAVGFDSGAVEVLREEGRVKGVGRLVAGKGGGVCTVESLRGATVR